MKRYATALLIDHHAELDAADVENLVYHLPSGARRTPVLEARGLDQLDEGRTVVALVFATDEDPAHVVESLFEGTDEFTGWEQHPSTPFTQITPNTEEDYEDVLDEVEQQIENGDEIEGDEDEEEVG